MAPTGPAITDARLGPPRLYMDCVGDTFDPAWSQDGRLYFLGNDGSGWNGSCRSNLFFNAAWGDDPLALQGETIHCMSEYGGWGEKGPDGCTWKSSGAVEVDGALYLAVGRHRYGTDGGDPHRRQAADRASIIRSTDGGKTWVRSAQENYDRPMFPAGRFATPYFIHYGQGGASPAVDNAERYVYAVSNNGFWCNGDNYILGRVERAKLGRLDPADWQFYAGGDGMRDSAWSPRPEDGAWIIDNPLKCGETGATYLPAAGRYILVAWHYPGDPNVDAHISRFTYYESPAPWGPWTLVKEGEIQDYGWYCPRVLARWQAARAGEIQAVIVTGGDYYEPERYYRLTVVPLALKTGGKFPVPPPEPAPRIILCGDPQVAYSGAWAAAPRPGALGGVEQVSAAPGDAFTIHFTGSRVKWYASKENNAGKAAVSLDGGEEQIVNLWTYCTVPQYRRMVFDSGRLVPGRHTFTVRVTGEKQARSGGITIYHDHVAVFE